MGETEKLRASAKAVTDANTTNPDASYFGRDVKHWSYTDWITEKEIQEALSWSETEAAFACERQAEAHHERALAASKAADYARAQANERFGRSEADDG